MKTKNRSIKLKEAIQSAEIEDKMQREFESKKKKWLEDNGFSESGVTYVYWCDDSYDKKEELKAAGFKFNPQLKWHKINNNDFEDKTICVKVEDVVEFSVWGEGHYYADARKKVEDLIFNIRPHEVTEWYGSVGEKIYEINAGLIGRRTIETRFGYSTVYTFIAEHYVFTWLTSTILNAEVGDQVVLSGTIKDLTEYRGIKQTVLTRCKVASVN